MSRPAPPRPAATVREALAAERLPGSVWQDSRECRSIQDSAYFMRACAQVVQLRRELAASEDYERLSARATELRKGLAEAPIVATSDPLPAAYSATLGRLVPLGGSEGVALLLTIAVELISCFGLAGLSVLSGGREERQGSGRTSARVRVPLPRQFVAPSREPPYPPTNDLTCIRQPSLKLLPSRPPLLGVRATGRMH